MVVPGLKISYRDFPGRPVVKTPNTGWGGVRWGRLIPGQGTKIPYAVWQNKWMNGLLQYSFAKATRKGASCWRRFPKRSRLHFLSSRDSTLSGFSSYLSGCYFSAPSQGPPSLPELTVDMHVAWSWVISSFLILVPRHSFPFLWH